MTTSVQKTQIPRADTLEIVKPRNYVNIIGWVLLALFASSFIVNVFTNSRWNWGTVFSYVFHPQVLQGLWKTIELTLYAGAAGIALGLLVGLMKLSASSSLRTAATIYIGFVRAIPPLVLILVLYFLSALFPTIDVGLPFLPAITQVPTNTVLSHFGAAMLGLTMIVGAHSAEIIRGGILSVSKGQLEAARALSVGPVTTYAKVILPQAVRVTIPAFATELISLFKNTSLVSIIGYAELLTVVQNIYGRTYQTLPMLTVACLWYLLLTIISMYGQSRLERKFGKGY